MRFSSYDDFSSNLKASIHGTESEYNFKYKITNSESLKNVDNFISFQVSVYDIQARIAGNGVETIQFWFKDLSVVTDMSGNNLAKGNIVGNLNSVNYISDCNNWVLYYR